MKLKKWAVDDGVTVRLFIFRYRAENYRIAIHVASENLLRI